MNFYEGTKIIFKKGKEKKKTLLDLSLEKIGVNILKKKKRKTF